MAINRELIEKAKQEIAGMPPERAMAWLKGFALYDPDGDTSKEALRIRDEIKKELDKS